MKKKILLPIFAIAIFGGGIFAWKQSQEGKSSADKLTLYGNVDIRQVELAFKGSERIRKMLAKEGDEVKKGELLATLDTDKFEANVALRKAELAAQQQLVAKLEAGSRKEDIDKARAELDAARTDEENDWRTYLRLKHLAEKHFISEQRVDDAKASADAGKARARAAEEVLKLALAGPRIEDIEAAKSVLEADRAALSLAGMDLEDANLLSPSDGIIQDRILEPGDMASSKTPVYTLALIDPVWVRAYVPESDLGKLKPGMGAEISTDSYPGKHYRGWVGYISPSSEFTPKSVETSELRTSLSYQVRIFACNPENELRLGMPATVTIPLKNPVRAEPCGKK
ncbi:MAG TPA: efflux RND transporter periplasmic adaptor subunit [Burkholderiales bacterium]|nr:efflux RND transporter periplasmic adaptor subunit [Burkholderiales bacterium]